MHQNDYQAVVDLVEQNDLRGELLFDLAHFEASGSLQVRTEEWHTRRSELFLRMVGLPEIERRSFLGRIAKFVRSDSEADMAHEIVRSALATAKPDEGLIEAGVEVAYELILRRRYTAATELLAQLESDARGLGTAVGEGRCCIEQAFLCHEEVTYGLRSSAELHVGLEKADRAMFLFSPEIIADDFFLNQARVNKGNLLRAQGRFEEAVAEYDAAEAYFSGVSVNSSLIVLLERAQLQFDQRNGSEVMRLLDAFRNLSSTNGRNLFMGYVWRLEAKTLQSIDTVTSATKVHSVVSCLQRSIDAFGAEGNEAEKAVSEALLAAVASGVHRPPNQ
jgi:tetratricopeptide (TPR) repeat protein